MSEFVVGTLNQLSNGNTVKSFKEVDSFGIDEHGNLLIIKDGNAIVCVANGQWTYCESV